jgi:hypothetical protein
MSGDEGKNDDAFVAYNDDGTTRKIDDAAASGLPPNPDAENG